MDKIFLILLPLSWLYGMIVGIRNYLYDKEILPSKHLGCRVISIGNITVGGTGKTPFTEALAQWLVLQNQKVGVVSRGYKRQNKSSEPVIISDGIQIGNSIENSGDEPYLLAKNLLSSHVPVIVSPDRYKAGLKAIDGFGVDIILLDDGFQHRRLKREIDIVLLDSKKPFGNGFILPAGRLRESRRQLKRADLIAITKISDEILTKVQESSDAPVIEVEQRVSKISHLFEESSLSFDQLRNMKTIAFCGIAHPHRFRDTLKFLGLEVITLISFRDHHVYGKKDVDRIISTYLIKGAEVILTTEKDSVKLKKEQWFDRPIYCIKIEYDLKPEKNNLKKLLL